MGDVLLSWFNIEEDDSITGYQILRGPDAENLVVIEDDTGSSSNQLHRRNSAPCGPDPHLRRKGPQRLGVEPSIEHAHRDCAGGKGRGSPHHRTARIYQMKHWFQTWDRILFLKVPLQAR